jgi:hypothetical protein
MQQSRAYNQMSDSQIDIVSKNKDGGLQMIRARNASELIGVENQLLLQDQIIDEYKQGGHKQVPSIDVNDTRDSNRLHGTTSYVQSSNYNMPPQELTTLEEKHFDTMQNFYSGIKS